MNTAPPIDIIITQHRSSGFPVIIDQFEGIIPIKKGDLKAYNASLRELAQELVDEIIDIHPDTVILDPVYQQGLVERLREKGSFVFKEVFADVETRTAFLTALNRNDSATIIVNSADFSLPWELLYLHEDLLTGSVDGFLGARHTIWRKIPLRGRRICPLQNDTVIEADRKLTVKLLMGVGLDYVREEIDFFQGLRELGTAEVDSLECVGRTRDQSLDAFGEMCRQDAHIIHFACHAEHDKQFKEEACLELADIFCLSIQDLVNRGTRFVSWPFVFLNACGTGWRTAAHRMNFVERFLLAYSRGLIATECDVPDVFAARFAVEFYKRFLGIGQPPMPIGLALLDTRRYFLDTCHNPLGLLYALYADPRLTVRQRKIST